MIRPIPLPLYGFTFPTDSAHHQSFLHMIVAEPSLNVNNYLLQLGLHALISPIL